MARQNKSKFDAIFNSDHLGLLDDSSSISSSKKPGEQRIIDGFAEITVFSEEHGRGPSSDGNVGEHILKSRLDAICKDPKKVKLLLPYDFYGLLNAKEVKSISVEEILRDDPLSILDSEDDESLFSLKHVKKTDRMRPEHISRRKKCEDFEKYKAVFDQIHIDLQTGKRKLIEFKSAEIAEGKYYVLLGVVLFLETDNSKWQEKNYATGKYNRLDGRTRCIFDNGTESTMLLRSLTKALRLDGFAISETIEASNDIVQVDSNDIQNGFIYVLRSLSRSPEIAGKQNLFKVGYSSGDVTVRVNNAIKEPTYLMSDVDLAITVRCFNLNVKAFETDIHDFFGNVNLVFEVVDNDGVKHYPREWFVAPLPIIEEAIKLIVDRKGKLYKYDSAMKTIILREPSI